MAERATIARPYAKAAFAWPRERSRRRLGALARRPRGRSSSSDDYATAGTEPACRDLTAARPLIVDVCGADLDAMAATFPSLLTENQRLDYVPAIADSFDALRPMTRTSPT